MVPSWLFFFPPSMYWCTFCPRYFCVESYAFTTWLQLLFPVTITLRGFLSWHVCWVTDPQETHSSERIMGCVLLSGKGGGGVCAGEKLGGKSIILEARELSSFMKGPVIHPFFIPSGSYCVFPCLWARHSAAAGDGRAVDPGVFTEKPLLLCTFRASQDRGITLQTAKKPLL